MCNYLVNLGLKLIILCKSRLLLDFRAFLARSGLLVFDSTN